MMQMGSMAGCSVFAPFHVERRGTQPVPVNSDASH